MTRLVKELSRLPGIGEKTASRLAFNLLNRPRDEVIALAEALLEMKERFLRLIVFTSQQAAEKIMKAYLTHHKMRFPKTHEIEDLAKIIKSIDGDLAQNLFQASKLTQYAIAFRYPDAAKENLTLELGIEAVQIAKKTVEFILEKLKTKASNA